MLCIPKLRIAILNEELALWEKRLRDKPDDIPYLGYIRTTLKGRVKELEDQEKELDKQEKNDTIVDERLDQKKNNGTKCK